MNVGIYSRLNWKNIDVVDSQIFVILKEEKYYIIQT